MSSLAPISFPSPEKIAAAQRLLACLCQEHNQQVPPNGGLPNGNVVDQRLLFDDELEDSDPVVEDDEVDEHESAPPSAEVQAALRRAVMPFVQARLLYLALKWQNIPGARGLVFYDLLFAATIGRTFPFNTFPNPGWISDIVSEMAKTVFLANRDAFESIQTIQTPDSAPCQEETKE
jgi:hypothetical protein